MKVLSGSTGPQRLRVLDNIHKITEDIFVRHDGKMEEIRKEVVRVGVDCVDFWDCHCCSVVVGPADKYEGWKFGK